MNPSVSFACGVSLAFLKIYFTNFLALVFHRWLLSSILGFKIGPRLQKRVLIEAKA